MNKGDLVGSIAKDTGLTKTDAEAALNATLKAIVKGAKKESVQLVGFGTFKNVKSKARNGVNPQTGAKLRIPARVSMKFKASKNGKY
ncbi:MAG: DNA-binding protein HU-beta [Candidatus Woesearchaeota archaeon]|jgi:DNA-binding protein HU-beta